MKTFHVYLHPARGYEAVQEGLCLPALCLGVFWLVFRGLAGPAALVVVGGALLVGAEFTAGRNAVDELQAWSFRLVMAAGVLTLWLLPVVYGYRWRHADLLKRGFAHIGCMPAMSGDDAIARALSLDAPPPPPMTSNASAETHARQDPGDRRARRQKPGAQVRDPRERGQTAAGTVLSTR